MKELTSTTIGAVESYTLINQKQSMKNALFIIHERDG